MFFPTLSKNFQIFSKVWISEFLKNLDKIRKKDMDHYSKNLSEMKPPLNKK